MIHFLLKEKFLFLFSLKTWFFALVFLFSVFGFSQDKGFVVPDSLKGKSFEELQDAYINNYLDAKLNRLYSNIYIIKAKKEKRIKQIYNGYQLFANITDDKKIKHLYLDSIINFNDLNKENIKFKNAAYFAKGVIYDNENNYKNALQNYLIAMQLAEKNNDTILYHNISYNIGLLKGFIGNHKEALLIFKKNYLFNDKMNMKIVDNENYLSTLHGMADAYLNIGKVDSAGFYNKLGFIESNRSNNKIMKNLFAFNEGMNLAIQNKNFVAIDSFNKVLPLFISENDMVNLSLSYYYIGLSYSNENKYSEGVKYFKMMDSIIQINNFPRIKQRNGYNLLINYYKKNNDLKNQLLYTNKLIKTDSLLQTFYKELSINLFDNFDTPKLIKNKRVLIQSLKSKNILSNKLLKIMISISSLLLLISLFYFSKQKRLKNRFNNLMLKTENELAPKNKYNGIKNKLSIEKVKPLLMGLSQFEQNLGFLETNLTQTKLAKQLNTNSSYLSIVINQNKNTNFSNYIKNLRIDYAIKNLKENKNLLLFSINGIANEFGFNNSETFSKAFYKKTGIYPSYFIKQLKKQKS